MGRNKYNQPLDKAERKRVKNGASVDWDLERRPKGGGHWSANYTHRTTDTRGLLWLFSRTMRGAAPFSAERAAVNTRPGAYDREMVRHLGDYADRDTELYAAAVQIYEERLAAARQGTACI